MPVTVRQRNLQSRHVGRKLPGGAKPVSNKKGGFWRSSKKSSDGAMLVTNAPTDSAGILFPGTLVALMCLLAARLAAAAYSHISDCDETYNYWEPIHYLIYGSGMQTWEYSPEFAIRSYAALWLWAAPANLLTILTEVSPLVVFYLLRALLATLTAISEALFYKAVCQEFGVHVGRMWLVLALVSCGAYVSSAAMLPSAWCAALATAALACWWLNRLPAAVGLTAVSALVGWPFAGLLGLPIAIDIVFRRRQPLDFCKWCCVSLAAILPPLVAIDSWYYGRLVLAPWNIVAYNIFTDHGPDLYGVEPWTFYFLNGFLNFNITWVMALLCPVWLVLCSLLITRAKPRIQFCLPYWLSLMPLYIWLAVFLLQQHKEERFLYPVHSMVCLCGAVAVDCLQRVTFALKTRFGELFDRCFGASADPAAPAPRRTHYLAHTNFVMLIFLGVAALGGASRILALYRNYEAPMSVLRALPPAPGGAGELSVCLGKEWHRSPSSFHLPHARYRLRFVPSDFRGQLPAQFASGDNATQLVHPYFNGRNEGDPRTYLATAACHYLVDSDAGAPTPLEPRYSADAARWRVVASRPLLDAARSHRLFRAFYVPYLHARYTTFNNLYLLSNRDLVSDSVKKPG